MIHDDACLDPRHVGPCFGVHELVIRIDVDTTWWLRVKLPLLGSSTLIEAQVQSVGGRRDGPWVQVPTPFHSPGRYKPISPEPPWPYTDRRKQ